MRINVVGASAGTGKTEYVCREILASLTASGSERTRVTGLVAVTYTRKAEAELRGRIRKTLIRSGAFEQAQQLSLAYIGTVHAVCLRFLKENAVVAGLSDTVDVMPEDAVETELARALESALDPERQRAFEQICAAIRPNWNAQERKYNWIADAADLMELARSNRVAASELSLMAQRSVEGLFRLLPPPSAAGAQLEADLQSELAAAADALGRSGDEQKNTQTVITLIGEVRETWRQLGRLPWMDWLRLTKVAPAKALEPVVARLKALAGEHSRHPQFRLDLETYVRGIYAIVQEGLERYSRWKEQRRVVDYVDMEERALRLLERGDVAKQLRERLDLVVVDEFQDTSPIQLELFMRLHELAGRSIWVGDRKQSIFAFRGADPALMESALRSVSDGGRRATLLSTNHRSRASLVGLVSELFVPSFGRDGYVAGEVRSTAARDDGELADVPPLSCWVMGAGNQTEDAAAIARGVARLLAQSPPFKVVDRETNSARPVAPADIAILCVTNDQLEHIAVALDDAGIPSVVRRAGLLTTPEGTFLRAALRIVANDQDQAALAIVEALTGFGGEAPDEWLRSRLDSHLGDGATPARSTAVTRLLSAVDPLRGLSPFEAVDEIIRITELCSLCAGWLEPAQRLGNLDAFRGLADEYANRCRFEREAVSISGFLQFLNECEQRGEDRQHAISDGGVNVYTYHRAKGLEWPVVILTGLDSRSRAYGVTPDASPARLERGLHHRVFAVAPECDRSEFDVSRPLDGRWIRFWPWPYGSHQKAPLATSAVTTDEARRVIDAEARESLRLLYVGFTRARDHIVVAGREDRDGGLKAAWLRALCDGEAMCATPRSREGSATLRLSSGSQYPVTVWRIDGNDDAGRDRIAQQSSPGLEFMTPRGDEPARRPYRIVPSAADTASEVISPAQVGAIHRLGPRAEFRLGAHDAATAGEAVHAFLASDQHQDTLASRMDRAKQILEASGMATVLTPASLVGAADSLREFVEQRWPSARWHREVPIVARVGSPDGTRRMDGRRW